MATENLGEAAASALSLKSGDEAKEIACDKSSGKKNRCTLCPKNCIIRPGCILNFLEMNSGEIKKDQLS